jgi:ABC-type sugar transport system permease subunit
MLCMPALLILFVFFLVPAGVGLGVSLNEWDGLSTKMTFVGLDNYKRLFATERFWNSVKVNWLIVIGTLLTQLPVAILVARALTRKGRLIKVYRTAAFAPQVLSIAAVGMIWGLIYEPYRGLLNNLIQLIGFEDFRIGWLGDPTYVIPSMLLTTTWFYFGFHTLLMMAGMAAIPEEYYDAARLETNREWQIMRYVTIPLLREQLLISFLLIFAGGFGHLMGLFALMTGGGPAGRTEILGLYSHRLGFIGRQLGLASAVSVVMLVIVLAVIIFPAIHIARERLEYT